MPVVSSADVAPQDLVGRWSFDEGSAWGTIAGAVKDSATSPPGGNAHGTAFGGAFHAYGGKNKDAAVFDGNDDYISIPSNAPLTPTQGISVAGWFLIDRIPEPASGNDITGSMVSKRNGYILSPNPDRSVSLYVYAGDNWQVVTTNPSTLKIGTWHHIVGTYDKNFIKIYVDGVEKKSVVASGDLSHTAEPICIGHDYCGSIKTETNRYFGGAMDEIMVYKRALSGQEVTQLLTASTSKVPGAACTSPTQTILRLYGGSNSHVAAGNSDAPFSICFNDIFPGEPLPTMAEVWGASGGIVLRASGTSNAHAESPTGTTASYVPLRYGDLACTLSAANEGCSGGYRPILALSGITNAHASITSSLVYPYSLCCGVGEPVILSVSWQGLDKTPLSGATSPYDGTKPFPFVVGSTKAKVVVETENIGSSELAKLKIKIKEIDLNMDGTSDEIDDEVTALLSNPVITRNTCSDSNPNNCYGTVEFEWVFTDNDAGIKLMYKAGDDETDKTKRFEIVAKAIPGVGSPVASRESDPMFAQASQGWTCKEYGTKASNPMKNLGKDIYTDKSIYPKDENMQRLAGEACRGPDGKIDGGEGVTSASRDDCCMTGNICTDLGCVTTGISQCQDYKNSDDCKQDRARLWKNKPSYVTTANCIDTTVQDACVWANNRCELGTIQQSESGKQIAQCSFYYDSTGSTCVDNWMDVEVIATPSGLDNPNCQAAKKECKNGVGRSPCGQPSVELPFFGMAQFWISLVSIGILYVIMFHFHTLQKLISRKR